MCGIGNVVTFTVEFGAVEEIDGELRGFEWEDQAGFRDWTDAGDGDGGVEEDDKIVYWL